jgi:RNA polymerase sigma factor (sigma-70 family)
VAESIDLVALCRGDKGAWEGFVRRYAGLIVSAVRGVAHDQAEAEDLVQDVFLRLCKDGFRLMRSYDPARAGLSTWLTIVARSTARDTLRRKQLPVTPIDAVPERFLAVAPQFTERPKLPQELLSPRQSLVLSLLYDRDMEVAEIAHFLGVDPQTVRSTHHKAMLKLRSHFAREDAERSGGDGGSTGRIDNKVMETKDERGD